MRSDKGREATSSIMSISLSWKAVLVVLALVAASEQAIAQMALTQPYAGLQRREIKALSREQVTELRTGGGMGLALAAELNGYPGPRHVLDLANQLGLTDEQRTRIQQLFDSMQAEAVPLGQKLLAAERDLDRAFAERTITPERLQAVTAAIGKIRGKLRDTHLKYHLATAALLNPDQIRHYSELRGYTAVANAPGARAGSTSEMTPARGAGSGAMHQHMMGSMHGE
jgi:Spy/CpxP family protein refolding chaperone